MFFLNGFNYTLFQWGRHHAFLNYLPTSRRSYRAAGRLCWARSRSYTSSRRAANRGTHTRCLRRARKPPARPAGHLRSLVTEQEPGAVCVNTQLPVLSGGEMPDRLFIQCMNSDQSFPQVSPPPLQLEHTQGTYLTPSSPPSVNPFPASSIFIALIAIKMPMVPKMCQKCPKCPP